MFKSHFVAGNPFSKVELRVITRSVVPVVVGQVLALNLTLGAPLSGQELGGGPGKAVGTGTVANPAPFSTEDGMFANTIDVAASGATTFQMYVVVQDLLDGKGVAGSEITVMLQGVTTVKTTSGTFTTGQALMANGVTGGLVAYAAAAGNRPIAVNITPGTAVTSTKVAFWGWNGFLSP